MNRIKITDKVHCEEGEFLIPLKELVSRFDLNEIKYWSLKNMDLVGALPSDFDIVEFEKMTRQLEIGIILTKKEFERFCESDAQVINGQISGFSCAFDRAAVEIECFDSTQWDVLIR